MKNEMKPRWLTGILAKLCKLQILRFLVSTSRWIKS